MASLRQCFCISWFSEKSVCFKINVCNLRSTEHKHGSVYTWMSNVFLTFVWDSCLTIARPSHTTTSCPYVSEHLSVDIVFLSVLLTSYCEVRNLHNEADFDSRWFISTIEQAVLVCGIVRKTFEVFFSMYSIIPCCVFKTRVGDLSFVRHKNVRLWITKQFNDEVVF